MISVRLEKSISKIILFVDYDALLLSQSTSSGTAQKLSLQFRAIIKSGEKEQKEI